MKSKIKDLPKLWRVFELAYPIDKNTLVRSDLMAGHNVSSNYLIKNNMPQIIDNYTYRPVIYEIFFYLFELISTQGFLGQWEDAVLAKQAFMSVFGKGLYKAEEKLLEEQVDKQGKSLEFYIKDNQANNSALTRRLVSKNSFGVELGKALQALYNIEIKNIKNLSPTVNWDPTNLNIISKGPFGPDTKYER